ncbi:juvenile hormone acid O-methyltransferase-like [Anoplolepis gracilipes]|uniref:juvenile hormone acid O-methyltransferase-like n=1 Tax=Anoplolepis gracilipes TaxID=354296 RepID=UPI003BA24078
MKFNPELTLKEENIMCYTQPWYTKEYFVSSGKSMEVNCGFGYSTRYFILPELDVKSTIIGTDNSESMIKYAESKYKTDERIDFEVFDIQTKNLSERYIAEFDNIFSFPTVHARTDICQKFQNIYKMLKPGGCLYIYMVTSHDAFTLYRRMLNHPTYGLFFKDYITPFHNWTNPAREVNHLLKQIGFIVQRSNFMPLRRYRTENLLPYILSGLSFINKLSPQQQEDVKDELTNEFNKMEKKFEQMYRMVAKNVNFDIYDTLSIYACKPPVNQRRLFVYMN